jgi:hypothetical protein
VVATCEAFVISGDTISNNAIFASGNFPIDPNVF